MANSFYWLLLYVFIVMNLRLAHVPLMLYAAALDSGPKKEREAVWSGGRKMWTLAGICHVFEQMKRGAEENSARNT